MIGIYKYCDISGTANGAANKPNSVNVNTAITQSNSYGYINNAQYWGTSNYTDPYTYTPYTYTTIGYYSNSTTNACVSEEDIALEYEINAILMDIFRAGTVDYKKLDNAFIKYFKSFLSKDADYRCHPDHITLMLENIITTKFIFIHTYFTTFKDERLKRLLALL